MPDTASVDPNAMTTVETPDGRSLTGVGVSPESLQETIESRAPEVSTPAELPSPAGSDTSQPAVSRDQSSGQFKKKTHDPQKRIGQLTAQREDAERRAAAAEQRNQELDRRLAALEAQRSTRAEVPPPTPQAPPAPPPPEEPNFDKDYEAHVGTEKYPTYGAAVQAYNRDYLAFWQKHHLDARVRQSIEADRASRAQQEHMQSLGKRGAAAYPDFDAVLGSADIVLGDTPEEGEAKLKVVLAHPDAEHLVYAIAKDRNLQLELKSIKNHLQLGYFLGRIPRTAVAPPAPTAPVAASQAPAPYQPVGSGTKTSTPSLEDVAASGNFDAYSRMRAAQRKGARR